MILATSLNFVQPEIQSVSKGDQVRYHLVDDYCFEWGENGNWYRRTVFAIDPETLKAWLTDLASTPNDAAVAGFLKCGTSDGASILHDRGYEIWGAERKKAFPPGEFQILKNGKWVDCDEPWTRLRCDLLFRKMCILGGMSQGKANTEFLALRVGALSFANGVRWYFS